MNRDIVNYANFLPEIVFETDVTGKITFFNQRAFEITGFSSEELKKGMNMLSFVVPGRTRKSKREHSEVDDWQKHWH